MGCEGASFPGAAAALRDKPDLMRISDELSVAFVDAGDPAPIELLTECKGSTFFVYTYSGGDDAGRNVANLQISSLPAVSGVGGRRIICRLSKRMVGRLRCW